KRRALSDIGAVTAHGVGWSARVYIDECNVLGPLRSCKEDAEADLERPRAASSREQLRLAAQRMKPGFASPVSLELCGINVQYPWSPLILAGVKAVEGFTQDADCAIDVGAPPEKARVIGVVRISGCFQYDWLHLGDGPVSGWVVGNTKEAEPTPADSKTMLGRQRPRSLTVSFRAV
ncbi:unnamed protein product, partial [Symbiodinium pilosum]